MKMVIVAFKLLFNKLSQNEPTGKPCLDYH